MKLNSYLKQSKRGIYNLRLQRGGKDQRVSLRTRDPAIAAAAAYRFGATIHATCFHCAKILARKEPTLGWSRRAPKPKAN